MTKNIAYAIRNKWNDFIKNWNSRFSLIVYIMSCVVVLSGFLIMLIVLNYNLIIMEHTKVDQSLIQKMPMSTEDSHPMNFYGEKASKIMSSLIHWESFSESFTMQDAINLAYKIEYYATVHNLSSDIAFSIVEIESDFRSDAYNEGSGAYGLCQITQPCLDEYNWKHGTSYEISQMKDEHLNLEVGFWYFSRIINVYGDKYGITTENPKSCLRDAYIAYNYGISAFQKIGYNGRNMLRNGKYPENRHGKKKGDYYSPIDRYNSKVEKWFSQY